MFHTFEINIQVQVILAHREITHEFFQSLLLIVTALIYNLPSKDIYFDGTKNISCFTACPASTEQEKTFNHRISITKNSLFLRNVYGPKEKICLEICDKPVVSATLYNTKNHKYEIGYEVGVAWCFIVDINQFVGILSDNFKMGFLADLLRKGQIEVG